jgi:cell wall-associated protease
MTIAKQIAGTTIVVTATDVAKNVSEPTEVIVEDVTPPAAPKVSEVKDYSRKVAGKAEAGSTVTIYVGAKVIGETTANSKGNFAVMITKQKAGTILTVVVTDLAENMSKSTRMTVIDKTPPVKPTVSTVTSTSVKVTGKAEVGSTVMVKVGSQVIGTALVGKDGKYSLGIPKQKVNVVLTVSVKDKSGNESVAVKVTVKK